MRTAGRLAFIVVSQRLLQLPPGVAAALGALLGVERGVGEPRQSRRPALALEQRGGRAKRVAEPGADAAQHALLALRLHTLWTAEGGGELHKKTVLATS